MQLASDEEVRADEEGITVAMRAQQTTRLAPTQDRNGFRKLLLTLTTGGQLFALHSGDGHVIWSRDYSSALRPSGPRGSSSAEGSPRLLLWQTSHDMHYAPQVRLNPDYYTVEPRQ